MLGLVKPCAGNPMLASVCPGWECEQQPLAAQPAAAGLALLPGLAFDFYVALPTPSSSFAAGSVHSLGLLGT